MVSQKKIILNPFSVMEQLAHTRIWRPVVTNCAPAVETHHAPWDSMWMPMHPHVRMGFVDIGTRIAVRRGQFVQL
jgi:hypothetical protein